MNYYNEIDRYNCDWLENLISEKLIPKGLVDRRSILDVSPNDLVGFNQCHFFAGIGIWCLALKICGHSTTPGIWTGSAPCQPLSVAGKGLGEKDERHLFPTWFNLISKRKPAIVLGEQVASSNGTAWLSSVRLNLEREGYAFGAADLPAAGGGAPHPRQRHFFVGRCSRPDADSSAGNRWHCNVQVGREQDASRALPALLSFRSERAAEPRPAALDHGNSPRVGRCGAYGNAIDPRIASVFIAAAIGVNQ